VLDDRLSDRPPLTGADIAALRADYAGEVSLIDEAIGQIFQAVRDRGEWDRTIVVFTSDHGEMNGDAGLLYKEVFLDGAVRVPLIIRHPGQPGAHTVTEPVELLDVGATVLDFVQPESEGAFRMGRSMAGVVRGDQGALPRTDALSEYKGEVMLATPEWKIGLNAAGETYLLFNRRADESTNLADAPEVADTQRAMENRVLQRLVASSSREPIFTPAGLRAGGVTGVARRWLGEERFKVVHERLGGRKARAARGSRPSASPSP
jgi:choline-sulfatase